MFQNVGKYDEQSISIPGDCGCFVTTGCEVSQGRGKVKVTQLITRVTVVCGRLQYRNSTRQYPDEWQVHDYCAWFIISRPRADYVLGFVCVSVCM